MKNKRKICITVTFILVALMLAYFILAFFLDFKGKFGEDVAQSIEMTVTRMLGGGVFVTIIVYLGYKILDPFKKPFWRSILFALPAFAVVINNLPFYPLISGLAEVTAPLWRVALLALECLSVGFFEETCFRGVVLNEFLRKRRGSVLGRFHAIVYSSAVFGAVHLINILLGSSPAAVIMQIGYSFLIGAMCAVVLMKSANIWLCVIIHGLFNFFGAVIPRCGAGEIWDSFTVILTAIVSLAVALYFVLYFIKGKFDAVDGIYRKK